MASMLECAVLSTPTVRLDDVVVRYGNTAALDRVSLEIPPGSRWSLLGENGAGKSTLASVLAGFRIPDSGNLRIDGRATRFSGPREAHAAGIGLVPQHDRLIDALTVAENLALGCEPTRSVGRLDHDGMRRRVQEAAGLLETELDPDVLVGSLSMAGRQRVAIANALIRGARLLVLDEPTAVLTEQDRRALSKQLDRLQALGFSIFVITHRLAEAMEADDGIHVLRKGALAATFPPPYVADRLAAAVIGNPPNSAQERSIGVNTPDAAIEIDWPTQSGLSKVSISSGSVVGIVGVEGSGKQWFLDAIAGTLPAPSSIRILGSDARTDSIAKRIRRGVASIGEDRHSDGIALGLSVRENAILASHRDPSMHRWGWLSRSATTRRFLEIAEALAMVHGGPNGTAGSLSGGNQQKLVLGRALAQKPKILVIDQPTRGLDMGSTARVHALMKRFARSGGTVIVSSPDLEEVLLVSERILVFSAGRLTGDLSGEQTDEIALGRAMMGDAQ